MPFTLSHAAAAWPFRRTRLEFSALVTGCFAPDFTYFAFLGAYGFYGHTLPGIFVLDLPESLVVLWLFHTYVKQPLTSFLPRAVRRRMGTPERGFSFMPPARFALIVLSIVVGALTHIAWDSFTHKRFWPYRHLSILRKIVQAPVLGSVGVYKLLQFGSTLFGLAVLAIWVWHWYRSTEPRERLPEPFSAAGRRVFVIVVPGFAAVAALVRALIGIGIPASPRTFSEFAVEAIISATTFFFVGLLVCGVVLRQRGATPQGQERTG